MSNAQNQYGSTSATALKWKSILAWAVIIVGVLGLVSGIMSLSIGSAIMGLGLVVPGAWYLYCAAKDAKEQKFYEESVQAYSIIGEDARFINRPQPVKRRWGVVSLISAAVLFVGNSLTTPAPVEADNEAPATQTSTQAPLTTQETTTSAPSPSPTTDAEKAEREAEASRSAEAAAQAETERQRELEREAERLRQEELRRMEEERARLERENELLRQQQEQQQQQQYGFAPQLPAGDVYYANCSEARAAGAAPIYAGEPGYARKLDRDGDGIACE